IFYLLRLSFPLLMIFHSISVTRSLKRRNLMSIVLMSIPTAVVGAIILLSPLTHHFIYYKNDNYYKGEYFPILSVLTILSALFSVIYGLAKKSAFQEKGFRVVAGISLFALGSVMAEASWPRLNVSSIAIATSMLLAYLSLKKPESMIDHTTGLLNLDALMTYMDELINREARYYVLVMKVENIRRINSIFGYTIGSLTLKNVADFLSTFSPDMKERTRLRKNLKVYEGTNGADPKAKEKSEKTVGDARRLERTLPPAWAFRLMSNQFAVVSTSEETHEKILELLRERFENPWHIRGLELNLLLTVAEMPETSSFAEGSDLYKAVEIVLPAVPKGDTVTVSERELAKIERHLMLETSLEKALAEDTLDVRFQPILSTATGRYTKVEALARFTHDEWGDVPASEFIPIAEKRGLVAQIDEFVLRRACEFIKSATDVEIEYVGINISVTELASSSFPKKVSAILDEYGIPYRKIVFEITENALMTSIILMIENLQELASMGFRFAVDNLALGKGDIVKLSMLPFSIVKLDRSVLEEVETSARSRILFENTIDVLKKIEIESVVVGCETTVQSQWISECSPDGIQGFYYARPMDKNGCLAFIQRNNAQTPKKPGRDNIIIVTE
ncbi:MAG: GGDEF domain-containing protein, partial [Saccharofermentanaceae bacterium]|nr:GGDEF domain-containing protein [Saccharofermentanaceae bacterium]